MSIATGCWTLATKELRAQGRQLILPSVYTLISFLFSFYRASSEYSNFVTCANMKALITSTAKILLYFLLLTPVSVAALVKHSSLP